MKKLYSIIGITIMLTACNTAKESTVVNFTRNDFNDHVVLTNPIEIPWGDPSDVTNSESFVLLHDSIILVQNSYGMPFAIELYSLYSGRHIAKLAPIGRGPGEFLDCFYTGHSMDQRKIYFKDRQKSTFYIVDFCKTLEKGALVIDRQFQYYPNYLSVDLVVLDDRYYTQYNMWYIDCKQYNNNVPKLQKYEIEPIQKPAPLPDDPMSGYKYWVGQANGARILLNPDKNELWLFDQRSDRIEIYSEALELAKTLYGPDHFNIQYEVKTAVDIDIQGVVFAQEKNYQTYISYAYNAKHIFVIYMGSDLFSETNPPVEIFKLDWEGNLLCNYKLDRYISNISIDSQEEYLYGTARQSYDDSPKFVRYKL